MTQKRISYIDLGAGILILWMILGHAIDNAWTLQMYGLWEVTDLSLLPKGVPAYLDAEGKVKITSIWAYFPYLHFLMPWFFYKSGQFFSKRGIVDEWKKDWNKLVIPLLIWSALGYVLYVYFCYIEGTLSFRHVTYRVLKTFFLEGYIRLNSPLWFLLTLIFVRQVANIVLPKHDSKFYWAQSIVIIMFGYVVSYAAFRYNHRLLPQLIANGAAGLAYFTMGYCLQKHENKWWFLIPCILGYLACCIWEFPNVTMKSNILHSGNYLFNMPACLCDIVVFNALCRIITKYLPILSRPFEYIGIYAMIIYVSHGLLYHSIRYILLDFKLIHLMPYSLWIILGAYISLIPIFCYIDKMIHKH